MDAVTLNERLLGLTVLLGFAFVANRDASAYGLVMDLAESESPGSRAVSIEFADVGHLRVSEFGGGVTQLLRLAVTDVSDRQWDRVALEVSELEREAIHFTCRSAEVVRQYRVGER